MNDFLSINPAPDTISINGKKVRVYGVSMTGFGMLMPRFPNLMADLMERVKADGFSLLVIIEVAGSAIGPILAAGVGQPGDERAEKELGQLDISTQIKLLDKIVEKTLPDGINPFVERWASLVGRFMPTQRKARFKILQRESNSSSEPAATPKAMSGE